MAIDTSPTPQVRAPADGRRHRRRPASRRRMLGWLFAAVLLPLAILLGVQYRWLSELEQNSSIARLATLENYLEAVAAEVERAYVRDAERVLNVPADYFRPDCLEDLAELFRWKRVDTARRLFVVTYVDEFPGTVYFYEPETRSLELASDTPEAGAVYRATAGWPRLAAGGLLDAGGFHVDTHDPEHRLLFHQVDSPQSGPVGLVGMLIDRAHFESYVLPMAISRSLPSFARRDDLVLTVRAGDGRQVLPAGGDTTQRNEVERHLGSVFSDWRIGLRGSYDTPDEWARANFLFNITLSITLAGVLLGGVLLALRTAAREMKLSQMKSDFVSNVSHELRTPLASIRVFGELMRLGRVGEENKIREFGEYIENESRRLTQLVNNLLDFSRIESGARIYHFEETDLEEVLRAVLDAFAVRFERLGVTLDFQPPSTPLPALVLDPDAVAHALSNLIDNAVKYSRPGDEDAVTRIAVRLRRDDGHAVIEVEDHGIGIARDEQEKIFDRFHRVGTGLVHEVRGSGLGLAIVRHVVAAHGGEVRVRSELGRGSTFTVHLPLAQAPPAGAVPERSFTTSLEPSTG